LEDDQWTGYIHHKVLTSKWLLHCINLFIISLIITIITTIIIITITTITTTIIIITIIIIIIIIIIIHFSFRNPDSLDVYNTPRQRIIEGPWL
jgi:hypothetical protein